MGPIGLIGLMGPIFFMNWISVTVADLNDAKVEKLVTALRTKALGAGQDDPTPRLTQEVVDTIRRKIASCANNRVDADTTAIPAGLKGLCVDLVLARLKGRLQLDLTQDERDRISRHESDLNRIASCTDVVEQPDTAIDAPVQSTSGTPSMKERASRRYVL